MCKGYLSSWVWERPLADVKRFRRAAGGPRGSRWQRVSVRYVSWRCKGILKMYPLFSNTGQGLA